MTQADRDFVRVGRSRIEGQGVFARRGIPRGTRIIEYTGVRVAFDRLYVEVAQQRIYTFRLDETTAIDGTRGGNESRLINHSCAPNCEAYKFDGRLYIYAMRDLARGEELTFDYQLSPAGPGAPAQHGADSALACRCGASGCRGTMRRLSGATQTA